MSTEAIINSTSAISDLHKLIESENPFDRSLTVRSHDVWEQKFPDVPSINKDISDAVFHGIEQIRKGQRSVLGITIKAERGLGKSHLISRIRNHLKAAGGCFFVYMSETDYGDLNKINSQFLSTLSSSLKQEGSQGVTQWQELGTELINQIRNSKLSPQDLLKRFSGSVAKDPKLVNKLTEKICKSNPHITDPYVVQAIFWTLAEDKAIHAIHWLSGKELTQVQADVMGLPVAKDDDRESRALGTASQILDLIGDYRSIVICFDEVEPKSSNAKGLTTPQVVALLAKDLYSKIKRGVLMMAIFPRTWTFEVKVMPQADSVVDRIGEKDFDLNYLNSDDVVSLVSSWLQDFYQQKGLTPPTSTYPFDESELRELGKEKPIVRKILGWCRDNWKIPEEVGASTQSNIQAEISSADSEQPTHSSSESKPLRQVEVAFNEQLLALDSNVNDYLEDSELIANALWLGFASLTGETLEGFQVQEVEEIEAKAADKGYINFKVIGKENKKKVKIGVSVLQESGAKYVSAGLKRLIDYKKFDLTRGCLVRSKAVKANTLGSQYLNTLLSDLNGEWVSLKGKDLLPLLAILAVCDSQEEYEVTDEEIFEFMQERKIAESNYLIREILSDPSGQIPDSIVDEDQLITTATTDSAESLMDADELLTVLSA
ncbi:P-loop NTPase fold protein [Leptolyngbyaceae cyanobacterium UHCC 1019]